MLKEITWNIKYTKKTFFRFAVLLEYIGYDGVTDVSELRPHGTTVHPRVIAMWTMV
jgi:hypothetical protein